MNEELRLSELGGAVIDATAQDLADYSVGFVGLENAQRGSDAVLLGSVRSYPWARSGPCLRRIMLCRFFQRRDAWASSLDRHCSSTLLISRVSHI